MSEAHVFRPTGDCTLRSIRDLRDDFASALSAADALVLDCGAVTRADVAFVQVIVAAHRTARRDAKVLRVSNLSEAVRSALARAGLPDADPLSADPFPAAA